eukprot:RCo039903
MTEPSPAPRFSLSAGASAAVGGDAGSNGRGELGGTRASFSIAYPGSPSSISSAGLPSAYDPLLNLQRRLRRASEHTDWEALSRQIKGVIRGLNLVTEEMPEEIVATAPLSQQASLRANEA